jgi:hypothetical protein
MAVTRSGSARIKRVLVGIGSDLARTSIPATLSNCGEARVRAMVPPQVTKDAWGTSGKLEGTVTIHGPGLSAAKS